MSEANEENWYDHLPEAVQATTLVRNSNDLESFHNRLSDFDSYQDQSIRIPSSDAGEDVVEAFNQKLMDQVPNLMRTPQIEDEDSYRNTLSKLGMPDEAKDYAIPEYENFKFDDAQIENLQTMAHKAGFTRKQFDQFVDGYADDMIDQKAGKETFVTEQQGILKEAWGMAVEERITEAKEFAKLAGAPQSLLDAIETDSVRADELMWLHKMSEGLSGEGTQLSQQEAQRKKEGQATLSPDEAELRINEILGNRDHPYHNASSPSHKSAQENFFKLIEMSNAGKKVAY